MKTCPQRITWREVLLQAVVVFALVVCAYPRVFFRGELISSADILFKIPPWDKYAPPGFQMPQNRLMYDPVMAFRPDFRLVQEALRNG